MQTFHERRRSEFEQEVLTHIEAKDFEAVRAAYESYRLYLSMFPQIDDPRRDC